MLAVATFKALRNLLLPGVIKIFMWCLLAYVVLFAALTWGLGWAIDYFVPMVGTQGFIADMLTGLGGFFMAWFLFPLLYPVLVSFFDEAMAEIVDAADYPHLPKAQAPFWPSLGNDVWFTIKALALNIICLPLLLIPVIGWMAYYVLNGYLLGMQFFRMAAGRRVTQAQAKALQKEYFGTLVLTGVMVIFMATIPFINLAAPILGVAVMIHLFYQMHGHKD